jgi:polysaccharide export outer membrane protein
MRRSPLSTSDVVSDAAGDHFPLPAPHQGIELSGLGMIEQSAHHGEPRAPRDRPQRTGQRAAQAAGLFLTTLATGCMMVPNDLPQAPLVPEAPSAQASALPDYRMQVGDVLQIRLLLNPELNEEVSVRPDGRISTTVVQDEVAFGRTPAELAAALRKDYSKDLQQPRVTVIVKAFAPARTYVGGEVNNPGEFSTVGPNLTLTQALARAGGLKLSADPSHVFIIRRQGEGQPTFLATNFNAATHAQDPTADVQLAPYDVVYVPKLGVAEVYKWYNQYIQQFANPSFNFMYVIPPTTATSTSIISNTTQ